MAKSHKRYLGLLGFGLLVIIAAGVWMVFGRKTQIYEKTRYMNGFEYWYDTQGRMIR